MRPPIPASCADGGGGGAWPARSPRLAPPPCEPRIQAPSPHRPSRQQSLNVFDWARAQLSVRRERLSEPAPGPREKAPLPFQGRQASAYKSQPPGGRPPPSASAQSALGAALGGQRGGCGVGRPSQEICIFLGVRTGGNRRPSDPQNPRAASGDAQSAWVSDHRRVWVLRQEKGALGLGGRGAGGTVAGRCLAWCRHSPPAKTRRPGHDSPRVLGWRWPGHRW